MKSYGKTIRKIREQKGYTIQQLAEGIVSVSFLSKFERGESDISLSFIICLLERLSLSFEEFLFLHDNASIDSLEYFFDKAEEAFANRDSEQLKCLKKTASDKWKIQGLNTYRCTIIVLDVYENIIRNETIASDNEDLNFLYNYLFDVEIWGYFELKLYNSTMFLMPLEMVILFSKLAYEKSARFRNFKKIDKVIFPILMNTLIYLTRQSTFSVEQYKTFFTYLENLHIPEEDLYIRNSLLQVQGIYEMRIGNLDEGTKMVRNAISIFNDLGSTKLAVTTENFLNIIIDEQEIR